MKPTKILLSCIYSVVYSLFSALLVHCGLCCLSIRVSPFSTGGGIFYLYIGLCAAALLILIVNALLNARLLSGMTKIKPIIVMELICSVLLLFPFWQMWQSLLKVLF